MTNVLHNKNMYDKCIAEQEQVWQIKHHRLAWP